MVLAIFLIMFLALKTTGGNKSSIYIISARLYIRFSIGTYFRSIPLGRLACRRPSRWRADGQERMSGSCLDQLRRKSRRIRGTASKLLPDWENCGADIGWHRNCFKWITWRYINCFCRKFKLIITPNRINMNDFRKCMLWGPENQCWSVCVHNITQYDINDGNFTLSQTVKF